MNDQLSDLLTTLRSNTTTFAEVLTFIDTQYQHVPTAFKNGAVYNDETQNQGSAKVFAFARQNDLPAEDTLTLFAEHYQAILADPNGVNHQNIRQFMAHGWAGIEL
jgi:hypothetical protein